MSSKTGEDTAKKTREPCSKTNSRQQTLRKLAENRTRVLRIVEKMIDCCLDEPSLIESCKILSKSDFEDVNVERSLVSLCGYPLCSNTLTNIRTQKYKISLKEHKVYDLTERKLFCSDVCFTASNFIKKQLREEPFWLTSDKESDIFVQIYKKQCGEIGCEVKLRDSLSDDNEDITEKSTSVSNAEKQNKNRKLSGIYFPYVKENQMEKLKESMSSLTIREKSL